MRVTVRANSRLGREVREKKEGRGLGHCCPSDMTLSLIAELLSLSPSPWTLLAEVTWTWLVSPTPVLSVTCLVLPCHSSCCVADIVPQGTGLQPLSRGTVLQSLGHTSFPAKAVKTSVDFSRSAFPAPRLVPRDSHQKLLLITDLSETWPSGHISSQAPFQFGWTSSIMNLVQPFFKSFLFCCFFQMDF